VTDKATFKKQVSRSLKLLQKDKEKVCSFFQVLRPQLCARSAAEHTNVQHLINSINSSDIQSIEELFFGST
jgi:hypothetical protein